MKRQPVGMVRNMVDRQDWIDAAHKSDPDERNDALARVRHESVGDNNPDLQEMLQALEDKSRRELSRPRSNEPQYCALPVLGSFSIPNENTYAAHRQLVESGERDISFSTEKYKQFDGVLAMCYDNAAAMNPKHRDYAKPQNVAFRQEIAILRNAVYAQVFPEGSTENPTPEQIQKVTTIANMVGNALQRGKRPWPLRMFGDNISFNTVSEPGEGAQAMYALLEDIQGRNAVVRPWLWRNRRANLACCL